MPQMISIFKPLSLEVTPNGSGVREKPVSACASGHLPSGSDPPLELLHIGEAGF